MPRHFVKARARAFLTAVLVMTLCSGNAVGAASPTAAQVQSDQAQSDAPYAGFVADAARRFGIPEAWIHAVIHAESGGDPRAVSPSGAMGLMQLMPQTWRELRAALSLGDDPFDPHDNIMAGAAYLRAMHDRYGMPGALAAYNAGPGRWEAFQAGTQPLPDETVAYVAALAPLIDVNAVASESPRLLRSGSDAEDIFAASVFARIGTAASAPAKHPVAHDDGRLSVGHVPTAAQPQGMFVAISTQPGSTANHAPVTTSVPFSAHPEGLFPRSGAASPHRLAR
jgi:membrane-bound lytic murein transglycosylase B